MVVAHHKTELNSKYIIYICEKIESYHLRNRNMLRFKKKCILKIVSTIFSAKWLQLWYIQQKWSFTSSLIMSSTTLWELGNIKKITNNSIEITIELKKKTHKQHFLVIEVYKLFMIPPQKIWIGCCS